MHKPVLLKQTLKFVSEYLESRPDSSSKTLRILDCTFGRGGHFKGIFDLSVKMGLELQACAIDQDHEAQQFASQEFKDLISDGTLKLFYYKFGDPILKEKLLVDEYKAGFDIILADFGVSSPQIDDAQRGFSFRHDGELDMRMSHDHSRHSAAYFLEHLSEHELEVTLRDFGEERFARKIAHSICMARLTKPFTRTHELAALCEQAYPPRHHRKEKIHPATRTFQALRILVNDELGEITRLLNVLPQLSSQQNSLHLLISFHSLEDRLAKKHFRKDIESDPGKSPFSNIELRDAYRNSAETITKNETTERVYEILKPFPAVSDDDESEDNPRARSAKLRAGILLSK